LPNAAASNFIKSELPIHGGALLFAEREPCSSRASVTAEGGFASYGVLAAAGYVRIVLAKRLVTMFLSDWLQRHTPRPR